MSGETSNLENEISIGDILIILMSIVAGGFLAAVAALLMPDRQATKS